MRIYNTIYVVIFLYDFLSRTQDDLVGALSRYDRFMVLKMIAGVENSSNIWCRIVHGSDSPG